MLEHSLAVDLRTQLSLLNPNLVMTRPRNSAIEGVDNIIIVVIIIIIIIIISSSSSSSSSSNSCSNGSSGVVLYLYII